MRIAFAKVGYDQFEFPSGYSQHRKIRNCLSLATMKIVNVNNCQNRSPRYSSRVVDWYLYVEFSMDISTLYLILLLDYFIVALIFFGVELRVGTFIVNHPVCAR